MTETSAKPGRRWLRFSLRTLLIVVTIVCVMNAAIRAYPPFGTWLLNMAIFVGVLPLMVLAMSSSLIIVVVGMKILDRFDRWWNAERSPKTRADRLD
jgi:hypothetical protein